MKTNRRRKGSAETIHQFSIRLVASDLAKLSDIALLRGVSVSKAAELCICASFESLTPDELAAIAVIKRYRSPAAPA